MRNKLYIITTV